MPAGEIATRTGRSGAPVPAPSAALVPMPPEQQAAIAYESSLQTKMAAARQLATATLLPRQYQNQPGNVLLAMEYGQALGISPIAVMLEIWVSPDGKPTCSSKMMQALVRSKGHKLRLTLADDDKSATCTIIRRDDPEFPTIVTYTMAMAQTAGLTGKKNWKENPVAMLKARAAAMCCRDACSEVLLGMYTPDELGAEVLDDELPDAGYRPGGSDSPAEPVEEGPDSLAHPERVKALVERFRQPPYGLKLGAIQDAVEIIIQPRRDAPMPRPADLTVEECQFIMDELDGLPTLEALKSYLAPVIAVEVAQDEAQAEAEPGSEEGAEA